MSDYDYTNFQYFCAFISWHLKIPHQLSAKMSNPILLSWHSFAGHMLFASVGEARVIYVTWLSPFLYFFPHFIKKEQPHQTLF